MRSTTLALLPVLVTGALAVNLVFFTKAGDTCDYNNDYVECTNFDAGRCCVSASPFCGRHMLDKGTAPYYFRAFSENQLCDPANPFSQCTIKDTSCCITPAVGGGQDTCSATWAVSPPRDWEDGSAALDAASSTSGGSECVESAADPDVLGYFDGTAMRRAVIPAGEWLSVLGDYTAHNLTALAALPVAPPS